MSILGLLPPELAHQTALALVRQGLVPWAAKDPESLGVDLFGKHFRNPIGLSAGADKEAVGLAGWEVMGFGFIEAGTVTLKPRSGNPSPRLWRVGGDDSLVNWLGLPGHGLEHFLENLHRYRERPQQPLVVGVSIASPDGKLDEFRKLAATCAPQADYLTLNASCPNVAGHGSDFDPAADMAAQVAAVVAEAGGRPLLVKLGPTDDRAVFTRMVEAALAAGAKGIVATNTVPPDRRGLLGDLDFAWPQHEGKPVGGYSGPKLLDIACAMVGWAREIGGKDMPLIGVGGIRSGADAKRLLDAGANLIQLYTALTYQGPKLLKAIKAELLKA
jgi:dihydroorotate dehydrogenase